MKSPFAIFRKNQRLGMALLTIMAMFAFVFLGNAGSRGGGRGGGATEVVAHTNKGKIDQLKIQELIHGRTMASAFLQRIIQKVYAGEPNSREVQQAFSMANFGPATRQAMVISYLMRLDAHRLGIVVSDTAIESYLDRLTNGKLSTTAFHEVLADAHWSSREVYDALRGELEAQMAFRAEAPRYPQTPDQYWNIYRQLKVDASVQVAGVPVKDFLSKVPDPSEKELREYFEANKNRWPGTPPDYKPGFKQPRRVQLQYLTASYEAVEKLVPEVTDKEVEDYYNENKEREFLETTAPKRGSETGPLEPKFAPDEPESEKTEGDAEKPAEKPDTEKSDTEKPDGDKPEAKPDEKPADAEKPAAEKKPAEDKPAPKDDQDAPKDEKKADEQGARNRKLKSTELLAYAEDAEKAAKANDPQPTATDAAPADAKPAAEEKPADKKPEEADKADKTDKPADDAEKPASTDEKKEPAATDEKPAESTEEAAGPKEKKFRPLTDELKEHIRERLLEQRTQIALGELADQASEAMTQLSLKYNTLAVKQTRGGWELYADLDGNGELDEGEPTVFVKQKPNLESLDAQQSRLLRAAAAKVAEADLERIAQKLQMSFGETKLVSAMQLSELPQIGNAEEFSDDPMSMMQGATNILRLVFADETLYRALRLRNPDTRNLIVAWKCQDVPAQVPSFADADVKEEVLQTWKEEHARPLAEKRAEELAKLVNAHEGDSVSKSLHDQTVTGEKDGTTVSVGSPPAFTWMRETAPPMSNPWAPKPPPQLSQIPFVERAGTKFMRLIFDELKEGQAGVAPNEDRSIFYVVKLERRNPGTQKGIAEMRETFMKTNLFPIVLLPNYPPLPTPFSELAADREREAVFEWRRNLEKRYALEWTNPSDEVGD